jgi:hypothetical protein
MVDMLDRRIKELDNEIKIATLECENKVNSLKSKKREL